MGRKIEMKKIVDVTKCQVTFSKRRSSLMKKANEVAVCCDADVAFIAFSPSGRVSKFSNLKKIEDLLYRYVNLPADKRLSHISNVQEKLEKINNLSHINGDSSKLHYLDKQIENLELQMKKTSLELQILETDIRDYEIAPDQEPSLHQLSWCERNLTQSLQRVIARKMEFTSANKGKQVPVAENPSSSQVFRQNDPWTGPSSARARESMFNDFQRNENMFSTDLNRAPFQQSSSLHTTSEHCMTDPPVFQYQDQNNAQAMKQSLPMDQPLPFFNFNEPDNADAYNGDGDGDGNADADADADADAYVLFSDSVHMSTLDSGSIQLDPRPSTGVSTTNPSTSEVPRTVFDEMGMLTSDLMGQFRHMDKGEQDENTIFTCGNNAGGENSVALGTTSMDQQGPPYVPQQEPSQVPEFDNSLLEETREDQSQWDMNQQRNNGLWEWDGFLLDENFNFHNFPPP